MQFVASDASDYTFSPTKGMMFSWQYDDAIILFPSDAGKIQFWATTTNGNTSDFSAYGWGLAPNAEFTAYSPYTKQSGTTPETVLPMTYTGQKQVLNGFTSHLSAYDYMKTPRTMTTSTALQLQFEHLGSIIRFEINMQETQILTSLTLDTETPITLLLDDIRVSKGGSLVAYMMVPPFTFADGPISVTLTNDRNQTAQMLLDGTEIVAGKCYPVTLQCPEFGTQSQAKALRHSTQDNVLATERPMTSANDDPILYPTAYAPDFLIDTEHPLEQYTGKKKLLGDVNDDGRVLVNDAVLLINYYLKDEVAGLDKEVCDVNGDGVINVADAVAIVNIYLKSE